VSPLHREAGPHISPSPLRFTGEGAPSSAPQGRLPSQLGPRPPAGRVAAMVPGEKPGSSRRASGRPRPRLRESSGSRGGRRRPNKTSLSPAGTRGQKAGPSRGSTSRHRASRVSGHRPARARAEPAHGGAAGAEAALPWAQPGPTWAAAAPHPPAEPLSAGTGAPPGGQGGSAPRHGGASPAPPRAPLSRTPQNVVSRTGAASQFLNNSISQQ